MPPPWDLWDVWDQDGPAAWRTNVEALAAWVAWLRQAYRWVRLPDCWPDHEGLRIELGGFWCWWVALHAQVPREQTGANAAALVTWHDYLRRAAEQWKAYADCEHHSVQVDQKREPRQRSREAAEPFIGQAQEHEAAARRQWELWTPVNPYSPEELRQGGER